MLWIGRHKEIASEEQPSEGVESDVINAFQGVIRDSLQRQLTEQLAEKQARYQRTDAERFQDRIIMRVTNGMALRPSPLLESAKSLSLTEDGETDMLTVHAHLAAMDAIWRSGIEDPDKIHAELQDFMDIVQQIRRDPRKPRYMAYRGMVRRLTEPRLKAIATDRYWDRVLFIHNIATIATGGRLHLLLPPTPRVEL